VGRIPNASFGREGSEPYAEPMSGWFWTLAAALHAVVGGLSAARARRWAQAGLWRQGSLRGLRSVFLDGLAIAGASIVTAYILGFLLPDRRFATIRFLAQALFGEGVAVSAWLGWLLWRREPRALAFVPSAALGLLLSVYWWSYHVGPHDLRVERHALDRTHSPEVGRIRVLHISDIQTWRVGDHERRAVREAALLRPDIVLHTGDYVDTRLSPDRDRVAADLRALFREERLSAPLGVFAVAGNTDGRHRDFFDPGTVQWLEDRSVVIDVPGGKRLALVGLSAATSRLRSRRDPMEVLRRAPPADLVFVVGHSPDYVMRLAGRVSVDLALAGHTHGGQIVVPFFGPPLVLTEVERQFAAGGLHDYQGIPLHVSRGVGMERGSAPQVRFLCPPEICLLEVSY
jgi:predicted MPP superfamily phosphohydrolase